MVVSVGRAVCVCCVFVCLGIVGFARWAVMRLDRGRKLVGGGRPGKSRERVGQAGLATGAQIEAIDNRCCARRQLWCVLKLDSRTAIGEAFALKCSSSFRCECGIGLG